MVEQHAGTQRDHSTVSAERAEREVVREGVTMALYITVSLLAVLVAVPAGEHSTAALVWTIWGTAIGLTLAHVLAFRLSARLMGAGELAANDRSAISAQAAASAAVAAIASVPLLFIQGEADLDLSRLLLAALVGVCAYAVGLQQGGTRLRALGYAFGIVVFAVAVALLKNALAGH